MEILNNSRWLLVLLFHPLLFGCGTMPAGTYSINDSEAGFRYAEEAIFRKDWDAAYRHLVHNLYVFDDVVKSRALKKIAAHPEIGEAARAFFSRTNLASYKANNPYEYDWVRTQLEVYKDVIATPEQAITAEENVSAVYAEEIAMLAKKAARTLVEDTDRRKRSEAAKAEQIRLSIARTCGSPIFAEICLGEAVEVLRERMQPRFDIEDGPLQRLVFDVNNRSFGVVARDGYVVAVLRLIPYTSLLDLSTLKLRLERAFGVLWAYAVDLPDEARDSESREKAIQDGAGRLRFVSEDKTLVLSLQGPEGIRLVNIDPRYSGTRLWQSSGMLQLLREPAEGIVVSNPSIQRAPIAEPVVAVLFRRNTSILGGTGNVESDSKKHFVDCVRHGIEETRSTIQLLDQSEILAHTSGESIDDFFRAPKDKKDEVWPFGINTLVLIDGTPLKKSTGSIYSGSGSVLYAGEKGLFGCGAGYGGAGCVGLAMGRSAFQLFVTVVDATSWRVVKQFDIETNLSHAIIVGLVLPFWWTTGPDTGECNMIGREIAEFLVPASTNKK